MILDAEKGLGHEPPRYDLCIVGAGPAGITLALELEATGLRVCLLEAGGAAYEAESQRLFEGEVVAAQYPALRDTRLGAFGGSTQRVGGLVPSAGAGRFRAARLVQCRWLALRLRRAPSLLCAGPRDMRARRLRLRPRALGRCTRITTRLLAGDATFTNQIFHVQAQNFGHRYRQRLERSKTIDLVLHAPITGLRLERGGLHGSRTFARSKGTSSRSARTISCSPPEGSRIPGSSCSPGDSPAGAPGNAHGLVGRYFTDHPYVDPGTLVLREPSALGFYRPSPVASSREAGSVRGVLALRREVSERERLMHGAFFFHPRYESHRVFARHEVKAFLRLWNKWKKRAVPGAGWPPRSAGRPGPLTWWLIALARKLAVGDGPARPLAPARDVRDGVPV